MEYTLLRSEQINELASALAKAQAEMKPAKKEAQNPFFKSRYASLQSIWDQVRDPLTKHGLSVVNALRIDQDHQTLTTTLLHSSGQWLASEARINPVKQDPQSIGSAITYYKRYQLAALTGMVTDEDDDGEHAMGRINDKTTDTKTTPPAPKTDAMNIVVLGNTVFEGGLYKGQSFKELAFSNKKAAKDYVDYIKKNKGLSNAHAQEKQFMNYMELIERGS